MKGEKGEGKIMEPMFPRLHVNDREKGGPRAPPRNKMALYEQLSIPSSGKVNPPGSLVQIPPPKATSLPPSASLMQGNHQRTVFAPSDAPLQPADHLAEGTRSQSLDDVNLNTTMIEFGRPSKRQANDNAWNANRSAGSLPPQLDSAIAKTSFGKNFEDEDDFRVPTFVHSGTPVLPLKNSSATDPKKLSTVSALPSNPSDKSLKEKCLNGVRSGIAKDSKKLPDSERCTEVSSSSKKTSNGANTGSTSILRTSFYADANLHSEHHNNGAVNGARYSGGTDVVHVNENIREREGSFSEASLRDKRVGSSGVQRVDLESENKTKESLVLEDIYRNEASEPSTPDSISGMTISPDDVVGVIGPKHFWKARSAIVNQQRTFAIQVFELHRLIQVQKLLAASPHVIEVDVYLTDSPAKLVPDEDPQPELMETPHQQTIVEQEDSSQKMMQSTEGREAITGRSQPAWQIPSEPVQAFSAPGSSPSPQPWCFHPQLNQWLFPVISASEGLIYKPYSGPCPRPAAGFIPPFYGNCMSFPASPADFVPPSSAVLPYHQQQPPFYFPAPYSLSMMNPAVATSAVQQVNTSVAWQQSKGSCDGSNQKSEVISLHFRKSEGSKGSEAQEGELTCCVTMAGGEGKNSAASLFPPFRDSNGETQSRVIRVVPRNARSATESAARIFRSIQEERKKYAS